MVALSTIYKATELTSFIESYIVLRKK